MQVKKFEARTMKEALEMVKKHLGPDAIILGARDNRKSFGLVGEGSVEITAAVSDEVLQKKKFTESRMPPKEREKFQNSPARLQKQVMENFVSKYTQENKPERPTTRTRYIEIEDQEAESAGQRARVLGENPDSAAQARIKSAAQRAWNAMHAHEEVMDVDDFRETRLTPKGRSETGRVSAQRPAINEAAPSGAMVRANSASAGHVSGGPGTRSASGGLQTVEAESARSAARTSEGAPHLGTHLPATLEAADHSEILALKSELAGLKKVLSQFQNVPQAMVTSHPGADFGLSYEFSATFDKMTQAGVLPELAAEMLTQAQQQMPPVRFKNKALVDAWAARYILDSTQIVGDKVSAKVQIFVGPAGSGKTSSLVKLAAHAAVSDRKRVVLLTADTFKVGAVDQMRIYANILNTPFAIVRKQSDWPYLLQQLSSYDLILCDFPGLGLKTVEDISLLRGLLPPDSIPSDVHLVLPSTAKNQDLFEIGKRFKVSGFSDVIFTALDESVQHGNIYNFMRNFNVPLHSFGTGPRVPEDFELATRERVLDLIFKLTKMKKAQE